MKWSEYHGEHWDGRREGGQGSIGKAFWVDGVGKGTLFIKNLGGIRSSERLPLFSTCHVPGTLTYILSFNPYISMM